MPSGYYGRGGIEVVKHRVIGNPTFEWGGEDESGQVVFDAKRSGWLHGPVHDLLVAEQVTAVLHGHDHLFAFQELDGIVYLACPKPSDPGYGWGFKDAGEYLFGDLLENSGHVQITVDPSHVLVEYIRSYLPGDGNNGEVGFSHLIQ
jgi:hypothetical protein